MATPKLIPIPPRNATLKRIEYSPANTPKPLPVKQPYVKPKLIPIPKRTTTYQATAVNTPLPIQKQQLAITTKPQQPAAAAAPESLPSKQRKPHQTKQLFCFIFDQTRGVISLADAYQSTCNSKTRQSFPYLYLPAIDIAAAMIKACDANERFRTIQWEYVFDEVYGKTVESIITEFGGMVYFDEITKDNPPPFRNVSPIARKRSKKAAKGNSQLNMLIDAEEFKAKYPDKTSALERCKLDHKPIRYVPPPPVTTLPPDVSGIRLSKLARDIAAAAASELGLPPLPTELELIEAAERKEREKQNKQWLKQHKHRSAPYTKSSKAIKAAAISGITIHPVTPPKVKVESPLAPFYPPKVENGKWVFTMIKTKPDTK